MRLSCQRHELPTDDPFEIARGTTTTAAVVTVEITHEGTTGVGGAAPSEYYGETADSVCEALDDLRPVVEAWDDPHASQRVANTLATRLPDAAAVRAAVSTALADLAARDLGVPCYRQWGLDPAAAPRTSYTVAIADPETMAERAERAVEAGYDTLKVKVGTDDDRSRIRAVRRGAPDATLRVDANCAWSPAEAIEQADWLSRRDVQFLEQPVAADDLDGLARVASATSLPVCADESCVAAPDVPRVADACDLVTVKLMKCGGVRPAVEQIHAAHAHGLDVLLGCMLESNASIAPAWHLAPLVEYADLDGAALLSRDPYTGVPLDGGRADLGSVTRGTGTRRC
ncbi:dipeptide epimerase [Halomicrobium sp. IBSBa]|uniref:dipeptide epimerase n=1 Tax=Halomicrobium sp. IBSBa TaxID=2778916 RepID=UPI001ABFCD2C|nr:dipeptide epimerase [Halomicrobium sp. IBSBa]MBO4248778.1 dipeptide epimerase [Halomicrobium sp. IBSBa]